MKPTIHFINNIAPHYMEPLIYLLLESEDFNFRFSSGKNPKSGIKVVDFNQEKYKSHKEFINDDIGNLWIKGKYLIWQSGVIRTCLFKEKPDLIILLGEFPILSNWIAAIICRVRGIPVSFRGHGLYGSEKGLKLFLRTTFYQLAHTHMVYERMSKNQMINNGFKANNIHVVFNSLDYNYHKSQRAKATSLNKREIFSFFNNPEHPTLIFSGRLTKSKKLKMLLETCKSIAEVKKGGVNVLIIGDGEEKENLEQYAKKNLIQGTYHFYGSCYDEKIIGKLFSKADLCVSPGNVGLTAIHSLSYGTPICTHNNFHNQGPEAEAIEDGTTGFYFEENNVKDLFDKTLHWITENPSKNDELIKNCYHIIDQYYNPYFQKNVFLNLAQKKAPIV